MEEIDNNFFELKGHVGQSCEHPIGAKSSVVRKSWPMWAAKCQRVGDKATDNDIVVDLLKIFCDKIHRRLIFVVNCVEKKKSNG